MVRLGVCTQIENAKLLKELGFGYIELNMSQVAMLSQGEYEALFSQAKEAGLPVSSMNVLLPGKTFLLCSDELDFKALEKYLQTAFSRAGELGVSAVSFGSGAARAVPQGMDRTVAMEYLAKFLRFAGPIAKSHGATIAIEPLRQAESNIINTLKEARQLCALADAPGVSVLFDLYHAMQDGDDIGEILNGGVSHCHIAEGIDRYFPKANDGSNEKYEAFFACLKEAGYEGGISIEGNADDFEGDARKALELLSALRNKYFE